MMKQTLLTIVAGLAMAGAVFAQAPAGAAAAPAAAAPVEKKNPWVVSASAGLTITRGNAETVVGNVGIEASKKWTKSDLRLGADFAYGDNAGVKNTEIFRAYGQYNYNFTDRLYAGFRVDFLYDGIAAIDYRVTVSPSIGYYFIKKERTYFRGEFGPSFIAQSLAGVTDEFITLRLAERFEHKFSDKAKIWQEAEVLPQIDDWENVLVNAEVGAEAAMTTKLALQTKIIFNYQNQPAAGRKRDDLRWITGVKYTF
jgi:putative salt-induced outer membrane protein YdiY